MYTVIQSLDNDWYRDFLGENFAHTQVAQEDKYMEILVKSPDKKTLY